MLLHSLGQTTPAIAARVQKAVRYLDDLPAVEQLEVACQLVVALLCVLASHGLVPMSGPIMERTIRFATGRQ
jgi:hypothetical protein